MMIAIFLFFPFLVFSKTVSLSSSGGGLEELIGGTGLAWVGSSGSLVSNPALLAWHPKKKKFISTNQLRYFKQGKPASQVSSNGESTPADLDVNVEVIPVYAATTDHTGEFGYGYGLSVDQLNATVSGSASGTVTLTDYSEQSIVLVAGAGKSYGDHGLGFSLYAGRLSVDQNTVFFGEDGGVEFLGHNKSVSTEWGAGARVGWAFIRNDWSLGASSSFNLLKVGGHTRNLITFLPENGGTVTRTVDHKRDPFTVVPVHGLGFRKVLGDHVVFGDVRYSPGYRESDGELTSASTTWGLGLVSRLENNWKTYLGANFVPRVSRSKSEDDDPTLGLSAGFSKAGDHSVNFGGVTLSQGLADSPDRVVLVTFGTQFDY